MSNKFLVGSLLVVLLIGCVLGWFAKGCSIPKPLADTRKDSTSVSIKPLEPIKKDSSYSIKIQSGKKYTAKISVKDSLGQQASSTVTTTVINDSLNVNLSLEMLPLKVVELKMTEITKHVAEYIEAPWYSNNWFYTSIVFLGLLILSLF